jgi:tape measure domain-containing protein
MTNRADLKETVGLYARLRQSRSDLSDEATRNLVDKWSKSLIISASSAQEAASSTQQFAQAMAAGVLSGQELRSTIQGNSAFAVYLAQSLGITTGALKQMGEEGKLTTDVILEGLTKVGDHIEHDFAKKALTIHQAMTNIETATIRLVGSIDQATGGSQGTAYWINQMALAIETFTTFVRGSSPAIEKMKAQTDALRQTIAATDEQIAKGGLKDLGSDAAAALQPLTEVEAKIAEINKRLEETGRGARLNAISQIEGSLILQMTEIGALEDELRKLESKRTTRDGMPTPYKVGSSALIAATEKALQDARRAYGDALIRLENLQKTPDSAFKKTAVAGAPPTAKTIAELSGYYTAIENYERSLADIRQASAEGAVGANRAVIQAMMDYLDAGGSLRRVLTDVADLSGDMLDPESVKLIEQFVAALRVAETIDVSDALDLDPNGNAAGAGGKNGFNSDGPWATYEQRVAEATKFGLMQAIETGDWADAFAQILTDTTREALSNALDVLWEALARIDWGGQGKGWGGLFNMVGKSFAGNAAGGGDVMAGRKYRVGELGSEWFIPKTDGYIIPNGAGKSLDAPTMISVGGATVIVNGNADSVTRAEIAQTLDAFGRNLPAAIDARVMDRKKRGAYG